MSMLSGEYNFIRPCIVAVLKKLKRLSVGARSNIFIYTPVVDFPEDEQFDVLECLTEDGIISIDIAKDYSYHEPGVLTSYLFMWERCSGWAKEIEVKKKDVGKYFVCIYDTNLDELINEHEKLLPFEDNFIVYGTFSMTKDGSSIWRNGNEVILEPKEFTVLKTLLESPGHTASKELLKQKLWRGMEKPVNKDARLYSVVSCVHSKIRNKSEREVGMKLISYTGFNESYNLLCDIE